MKAKVLILSGIAFLALAAPAIAGHVSWGVGIGFGGPFYGGYPGYYSGYPYGGYPYGGYPYGYSYPGGYNTSYPRYYRAPYYTHNRSTVARVQARLARAGYYAGPVDGVFGPRTRYAIRVYERRHGLPVDGRIDRRLLATMGLA